MRWFDDLSVELETFVSYVAATNAGRTVRAVPVARCDATAEVGRLVVALINRAAGLDPCFSSTSVSIQAPVIHRLELFTGERSRANLRLYERHGYREYERRPLTDGINLVYLEQSC